MRTLDFISAVATSFLANVSSKLMEWAKTCEVGKTCECDGGHVASRRDIFPLTSLAHK